MASAGNKNTIFQIIGLATIPIVFLLILLGATVRSTGAGMGCPDWPKCFGQWVPPTDVAQLPENYREIYAGRGYDQAEFNAVHTWTEYINRLFGVVTGFFIIGLAFSSLGYWRKDKTITILSFLSLFLVSFQGWIGARVVASNLAEFMISVHLWLALLLVSLLIYTLMRSYRNKLEISVPAAVSGKYLAIAIILLIITLLQTFAGTYVRAEAKMAATAGTGIFEHLVTAISFLFHRSFSVLIVFANAWFVYKLIKSIPASSFIKYTGLAVMAFIFLQVFTGIVLSYFSFPAWAQAFHMLFSATLAGAQFMLVYVFLLQPKAETANITSLKAGALAN